LSFGVHQKYIRYILNAGRRDERFFPLLSFLSAMFKPTRRKPGGPFSCPGKTGFRFGYKGCAIVRIWVQRMSYIICLKIKFATPFIS
jgi:hypothetical protein